MSCNIKCLMVSTAAGLGALFHILSVAPLLECLPGNVLLDVLTLLPGGGGALPTGGAGAVFLSIQSPPTNLTSLIIT